MIRYTIAGADIVDEHPDGKWVLEKDARAEIERLTKAHDTVCGALAEATAQIIDLSTRLGQAEGRLLASEMAGAVEGWRERALKAEAALAEASDPDFIWGALDNVHDAETTLDDYAAAVSRAIRGQMETLK